MTSVTSICQNTEVITYKRKCTKEIEEKESTSQSDQNRCSDENWKSCNYIGSLFDTTKDILRRKQLAMNAFLSNEKSLANKFNNKNENQNEIV